MSNRISRRSIMAGAGGIAASALVKAPLPSAALPFSTSSCITPEVPLSHIKLQFMTTCESLPPSIRCLAVEYLEAVVTGDDAAKALAFARIQACAGLLVEV